MLKRKENLIGKKTLLKNVFWNLFGTGVPLIVAIITIPILIEEMGVARFGVLSLAWMVVGYFSLFDLGLGRALTKLVSERLGTGKNDEIPAVIWNAMSLMGGLALFGSIVIISISPWLVYDIFKISEDLQAETLSAFYYLGLSIPIVISSTGLRGILEAYQRFGVVNAVRLPLGLFTFIGPLAVLPFSNSLADIVLVLVLARIISWLTYLFICLKLYPELRNRLRVERKMCIQLLSFGGWMTLSNISAPLLLYLGRVMIVIMISAEAVAYFVTPYEVVIKLLIIPGVLVSVLFPVFTHLFQKDSHEVIYLYNKAMLSILFVMLPLTLLVFFFAKDGLALWINEEFSLNSYFVAQILAVGVFINSFGHLSQALIQSYGRPDLTAKLHLIELLLYIPYLWFLIEQYGINGAAIAWTIRVTISTIALSYMSRLCTSGLIAVKY